MHIRKLLCLLLALLLMLTLFGCGSRTVICDGCGKDITVKANSNITDEWIVYCSTCEKDLFGEDGLVS